MCPSSSALRQTPRVIIGRPSLLAPSPDIPTVADGALHGLGRCLAWLDGVLAGAGAAQHAGGDAANEFRGLFVSQGEVDALLDLPPLIATFDLDERLPVSFETSRLGELARAASLTPFDEAVLLLALAPHLDRRYGRLYAYLQDDLTKPYPTPGLALQLFSPSFRASTRRRQHFEAGSALRRLGLLALGGDDGHPLITRPLAIDNRLASYLTGDDAPDTALAASARVDWGDPPELVLPEPSRTAFAVEAEAWRDTAAIADPTLVCIAGGTGSGRRLAARHLAAAGDRPLLTVTRTAEAGWRPVREALLQGAALCLADADPLFDPADEAASAFRRSFEDAAACTGLPLVLTLSSRDALPPSFAGRRVRLLQIAPAGVRERGRIWQLEAAAAGVAVSPEQASLLASTYRFSGAQVRDAVARASIPNVGRLEETLAEAARALSAATLGRLGQEIAPRFGWRDIVLPDEVTDALHEVVTRVRHHARLFDEWGFDALHSPSRSLSALFSGPSGTGKTMAAEVIAAELGLPLYRVDLSAVVSKYIGETEKNLSRIFADASASGAILFFDEADALFGRRSEVRDSHDRYANLEVSYLLQRMDDYDGIVILASNLRQNMDEAFVRRLHLAVDFPFPDEDARLEIWRRTIPARVPLAADVDLPQLARRYRLSGGHIRNAVVTAAFLAAGEGADVWMRHFVSAVRREHQKMGKLLISEEAGS